MACEKLGGIEVPKRGEYCRVIAAELNRIASHLLSVGTMAHGHRRHHAVHRTPSASASTSTTCSRSCAARASPTTTCASAASPGTCRRAASRRRSPSSTTSSRCIDEYNDADLATTRSTSSGCANVAVITRREAIDYNLVGPNLRGSGVALRRAHATSRTRSTPSSSSTCRSARGELGTLGDCCDRYIVRMREMKESCQHPAPVPRRRSRTGR